MARQKPFCGSRLDISLVLKTFQERLFSLLCDITDTPILEISGVNPDKTLEQMFSAAVSMEKINVIITTFLYHY